MGFTKEDLRNSLKNRSYWTKTKYFGKLVKWAFDICDRDKKGSVSKTELYVGVLMVHLKLSKFAGPAATFPPTRDVVDQLFEASDADQSGDIDEEEFVTVMIVLCSQITSRMILYYAILILLVPYVVDFIIWFLDVIGVDSAFFAIDGLFDKLAPSFLQSIIGLIPDGTWEALPETIVSLSLFYLVIPVCWEKLDEYFEKVASKKAQKQASKKKMKTTPNSDSSEKIPSKED